MLRDPKWVWPLRPLPWYSLFVLLLIPNLILSMRRNQRLKTAQVPVMIAISCMSYVVTALANKKIGLTGHPNYTALLGSFVVILLGNLYSRKFGRIAFTIMLTGIWLSILTSLAEVGGLSSTYTALGEDEYTESLILARKSKYGLQASCENRRLTCIYSDHCDYWRHVRRFPQRSTDLYFWQEEE